MAIIPLRAYNREIEGMIDNGKLDEAVAHCRHILATFPKHIGSYRLLGKAHLEQQRISDATDIFQRVLSSVPDDFISNVGMSIIREDENNLDASIWHMELAYESQPSNVAIQDELRRLYGRRDGMQPPKVRLTRGALARMYAKGGLFDQAIAELRAAISEEPNRPDLQLLLAEMFFQTSQRVEAVETCANILKKIPLCLEANRILAVSLPEADGSEAIKNYRQIVISMDPYYAFAGPEALSSDQVPENAVNIERLDWKSGIQAPETPPQPNWAASLGISVEKPADENMPEWLKSAEAPPSAPISESAGPVVSPFIWDTQEVEKIITDTSQPEPEIPDWMKDAGWQPGSSEEAKAPEEVIPEEPVIEAPPIDTLESAEVPDWLRGIAPEGALGEEKLAEQAGEANLSTPWLEQHQPGPTDSIINWLEEQNPETPKTRPSKEETLADISEEEVPDWLKDLEPPQALSAQPSGEIAAPTSAFTAEPSAFTDEPLPEIPETKGTPFETFLQEPVEPSQVVAPPQVENILPENPPSTEASAALADDIPDWLRNLAGEQSPDEESNLPAEDAVKSETGQIAELTPSSEVYADNEKPPIVEIPATEGEFTSAEVPAITEEHLAAEVPMIDEQLFKAKLEPITEEIPTQEGSSFTVPASAVEEPPIAEKVLSEAVPVASEGEQAHEVPSINEPTPSLEQPILAEQESPIEVPSDTKKGAPLEESVMAEESPSEEVPFSQEEVPVEEVPPREVPSIVDQIAPVEETVLAEEPPLEKLPAVELQSETEKVAPLQQPVMAEEGPSDEIPAISDEVPTTELPIQTEPMPVSELLHVPEQEPPFETSLPGEAELVSAEPGPTSEQDTLAWLEGLVAGEASLKGESPVPSETGEILPPEWVKLEAEPPMDEVPGPKSKSSEEATAPAEETPDWIKGLGEEPETEQPAEEPSTVITPETELPSYDEELPAWLRELEEPELEKDEAATTGEKLEWKPDELPAWLKEITEAEPAVEIPATAEAPIAQEIPASTVEPASEWTGEATPPAGIKKEALEETPAESGGGVPAEKETVQPLPPPVEVPPIPEPVSEEMVSTSAEILSGPPEGAFEALQAVSKANQNTLSSARECLNQSQPVQAAELYTALIKQNYHLDEIIKDLQDALYRYPVDASMWITLGDAYFHTDDLLQALSAYTKAEELIR